MLRATSFLLSAVLLASAALAGAQKYTLLNQQPNTPAAYSSHPNSIMYKRLPPDVLNHLWGNTSNVLNSNLYGKCITTDCGAVTSGGVGNQYWGALSYSQYGNYDTSAIYWGQASDPWWVINGCSYCAPGWTSGPFHMPSNVEIPGANYTGNADAQFTIFDEATGMVVSVYGAPGYTAKTYTGTCPGTAGSGTIGSPCVFPKWYSSASSVANYYKSRDWQSTNPSGQGNLTSSLGLAPFAGTNRVNEFVVDGVIPHAEYDSTDCISAPGGTKKPAVFPGTGTPGTLSCYSVGKQSTYRPQEGMLYFADYTDQQLNCMDPGQPSCTYASDGASIPKVQPFQMVFLTRFAHYGSYIGETSNRSGSLAEYAGWHDDVATDWDWCGAPCGGSTGSPFWAWASVAQAASGSNYVNCWGPRPGINQSAETCSLYVYANVPRMPGLSGATDQTGHSCTSGHGCDLSGHVQVADPCVAVGLSGLSSSGGVSACY